MSGSPNRFQRCALHPALVFITLAAFCIGLNAARPAASSTGPESYAAARQIVYQQTQVLDAKGLDSAYAPWYALFQAREAVKLAPDYAPAHRLLGRALMEEASFDQAAASYRRSLQLDPRNWQGKRGLREAERLAKLVQSLPLAPKKGRRVFRLAEIPRGPRPGVFVLVGEFDKVADGFLRPEARYFVWRKGRYRETFYTATMGRMEEPWRGQLRSCRTWVGDFQRVGRQQVILVTANVGGDWEPTFVDVFEEKGDGLTRVLAVDSDHPPKLTDLDHDGRPEIRVDHLIGSTVPHAGMDIWYDVYRYNGRRYARANARFPQLTRDQIRELQGHLEDEPNDPEFLKYMAIAYRDLGQPEKARPYENRARRGKAH